MCSCRINNNTPLQYNIIKLYFNTINSGCPVHGCVHTWKYLNVVIDRTVCLIVDHSNNKNNDTNTCDLVCLKIDTIQNFMDGMTN